MKKAIFSYHDAHRHDFVHPICLCVNYCKSFSHKEPPYTESQKRFIFPLKSHIIISCHQAVDNCSRSCPITNLLRPLERCIHPAAREQLLPGSDLRDTLIFNDGYLVRIPYSRQSMRNNNTRPAMAQKIKALLNTALRHGIEG